MRVCLLTTQDLDADPFPPDDWPCDPRPFLPLDEQRQLLLQRGYVGLAEDLDEERSREEIQRAMRTEREQRRAEEAAGD